MKNQKKKKKKKILHRYKTLVDRSLTRTLGQVKIHPNATSLSFDAQMIQPCHPPFHIYTQGLGSTKATSANARILKNTETSPGIGVPPVSKILNHILHAPEIQTRSRPSRRKLRKLARLVYTVLERL
jgi:hypothetical protein